MTRVMIVDDEKLVLGTLRRMVAMRMPGADIRVSDDPLAAKNELIAEPADLLITDRNMPGMGGEQLIREVRETRPETVCILLTGDSAKTPWYSPEGCFRSLGKPVNLAMLGETLAGASEVLAALNDKSTRRCFEQLGKVVSPTKGELPFDGRRSGKRWIEAYGTTVGMSGQGINTSASVMKIMSADFIPALAIITGFVEQLSSVTDPGTVDRHWRETLDRANDARLAVAGKGIGEAGQLTVQLKEFVSGVGRMLGELFDAPSGSIGLALFSRWGFTQQILGATSSAPA